MRKHLVWMIALAIALTAAGVASATDSSGTDFSTFKMKVTPTKLSKKKYKPAKLFVETSTLNNSNPGSPTSPGSTPVPTTDVKLKFDKDLKFTSKGLAQCSVSKVQNATTSQAKQICGKAKVGGGSAYACVVGAAVGVPCTNNSIGHKQTVVAFNGKPKGGKPTIVLHSWSTGLPVPTVLVGTLNMKSNTLDVPIPKAVYTLATITDFKTTVQRSFKVKKNGKKKTYHYVTARCSHKKLTLSGTFSYLGSEKADHVSAPPVKCKGS